MKRTFTQISAMLALGMFMTVLPACADDSNSSSTAKRKWNVLRVFSGKTESAPAKAAAAEPAKAEKRVTTPAGADSAPTPPPAPAVAADFVIGREDVLSIHVWQEAQMTRVVTVRPDGKISIPLVGELVAAGQTPARLQASIADSLKSYLSNPQVTVIVEKVNSQKFNVLGEVLRPGSFDLAKQVSVLDAIAMAGGFRDFAKTKDVYVLRRSADGAPLKLPFNYREVMKGRGTEQNILLQPGDTIIVP